MDLAARLRRRGEGLTSTEVLAFASLVGLDQADLVMWTLPLLDGNGVIAADIRNGEIRRVDEFVGVAAPFLEQVAGVWQALNPPEEEECALESVDLAAHAPMAKSDHFAALEAAGFPDHIRESALHALAALSLVQRAKSEALGEDVIYNEYVWGDTAISIANFLKGLPPDERDILTTLSSYALEQPGSPATSVGAIDQDIMRGARKVGFLDPATVVTRAGRSESFIFSPALENELAARNTSDSLHERKLFVAHIMFGHHFGFPGTGRIISPRVLVRALLNRGTVGPATAITTDYPLLESHGIVRVRPSGFGKQSYLELVKEDVVKDALDLLETSSLGTDPDLASDDPLTSLWLPGSFVGPEDERAKAPTLRPGPARELFDSTIDRLREATAEAARGEDVFE